MYEGSMYLPPGSNGEDLEAEARKPTNMTKIYNVKQGKDENPGAYLERLIDGGF